MWFHLLILFALGFFAATISGVAGFGGSLMLLPVLGNEVGMKAAIPILTIAQLFGNGSRAWFGRRELQWKPILYFLMAAVPLTIVGGFLFAYADSKRIKTGIGLFLLVFVTCRGVKLNAPLTEKNKMLVGGGITGFLSGLAGSAGPISAAFFLMLNLPPGAYIASEAFSALVVHLTKTAIYNKYALLGTQEIYCGIFIGMAMIAGSWCGKAIAQKLNKRTFARIVDVLLVVSALQLLYTSLQ